ncbi:MAG: adenylosuccinate synthase [Omnitrophica bacterium RIFCSPHIGHO2_02_FULL_51_18]|nr:MAG: adenylosuccinate synthase [Omnitrophica bacterium RIFCSPHIGHO2_02_FULL_51_18]
MPNTVVVGAQWGDEGKGKIIDILSEHADYVVRYQGGNNAGHTVVKECGEFVLHLIPSGIFHKDVRCVIGNGVVIDPDALLQEINNLNKKGISVKGRLFISDRAHLIFPYHKTGDRLRESQKGFTKIGTTGRGIGPSYADKASRSGIRIADLCDGPLFREKLKKSLLEKNKLFEKVYRAKGFKFSKIHADYLRFAKAMRPYVCDTAVLLNQAIRKKKCVLFEGAQGTHLDVDHGTYPFVTSSYVTAGGAAVGTGVPPTAIDNVIGVVKAYTTRVGEGPFPTEFDTKLMARIRRKGREFGATTGRPRRCGWFDAVLVKYSCMINGIQEIAVTKLDVLDDLKEIKICVAYRHRGRLYRRFPASLTTQWEGRPVYETHRGWMADTSQAKKFSGLPENARKYLHRLSELLGVPITILSIGSHEKQTLYLPAKRW